MENILNITIPLILTGLGFITYKHPAIARKLLKILLYSTCLTFFISIVFSFGRRIQFYQIAIQYLADKTKIENILNTQNDLNSSLFKSICIYFGLTLAVIAIFYFLSGLFDKVRNPEIEKTNDNSKNTNL